MGWAQEGCRGRGGGPSGPCLLLQTGLKEPKCPADEFGPYPECQSVTGTGMSGRERKLGFRTLGGDGVDCKVTPGGWTGMQGGCGPLIRRWACGRGSGGLAGAGGPRGPRGQNSVSSAHSQGPGGPPGHPRLRALLLRLPGLCQPLRANGHDLHAPGGESEQRCALALV